MIPAVVYGPEIDSRAIALNEREVLKMFRTSESMNILVDLSIEGEDKDPLKVMIKEVQREPIDSAVLHIDFQQISLTQKITVDIPIRLVGTAEGVKTMGGILEFVQREVSVACLPNDIEDYIEIDVTELVIGDSLHVRDLDLQQFEVLTNPDQVLITIAAPTVQAEAEEEVEGEAEEGVEGEEGEAEAEAEDGEKKEPEVIKEKKKE
jgi:large subunit ribosomal protein L25